MFFHIVYNLHVMLDDIFLLLINIYGPQIVMYYLYAYYTVESGIKQLNWIELNIGFVSIMQAKSVALWWQDLQPFTRRPWQKWTSHVKRVSDVTPNNGILKPVSRFEFTLKSSV